MSANLVLHAGGRQVSYEALAEVEVPPATRTWVPIQHTTVLNTTVATLKDAGYAVAKQRLALSSNGTRFFGVLDLTNELTQDGIVTLAVGIRSSYDKTFPLGFVAGTRVFVCDNLAFAADLMVKRKHSLHGAVHFGNDIANAVMQLGSFQENEAKRITLMQETSLSDERAESLMLRACLAKQIVAQRQLPTVWNEWREPRHEVFQPRTAWSLMNAFTATLNGLQDRNPADLARRTMRLHALLTSPGTPSSNA